MPFALSNHWFLGSRYHNQKDIVVKFVSFIKVVLFILYIIALVV